MEAPIPSLEPLLGVADFSETEPDDESKAAMYPFAWSHLAFIATVANLGK
jgi:hypothetical protein